MNDTHDLRELAKLEGGLWLVEQQAKHVISGLGRSSTALAKRVEMLQQASALYAEIRRIRETVHELRGRQ